MDEGDGTLWLANASKLRCRFLPRGANEDGTMDVRPPEVLFFEEEDFEEEMRETESVIECPDCGDWDWPVVAIWTIVI